MRSIRRVVGSLCLLILAACGGGGGGGGGDDTSISLSTSSVTLAADVGTGQSPTQTFTVNYRGAGVVVGTLPGQTLPTWLGAPIAQSTTATQVVFSIQAYPFSLSRGSYTTTLRFITGHADQTHLKTADLSITLRVNAPFTASTTAPLSFLQVDGAAAATAVGPSSITIGGDDLSWHASANQPWVAFAATSGTQAGALAVNVNRQSLALGVYTAQITLTEDRRNRTVILPLTFEIRPARLSLNAAALQFDVDTQTAASQFERPLSLADELGGVNSQKGVTWSATTNAPWLELSSTSGASAPAQQLIVRLPTSKLNVLPSGTYTTNVEFSYQDSAGGAGTLSLPVTLNVRMPLARAANPYLLTPGVPATIALRGEDIRSEDFGSLIIEGATPDVMAQAGGDDKLVTLQMPALAAGVYPIRFPTASGLTRSVARIVVQAPSFGEGVIESVNEKRLVLDEQRGRLLAIDRTQFEIEAYRWTGSAWTLERAIPIPELADAALSRNGEQVIVLARQAMYTLDADDLSQAPVEVWRRPTSPSYVPSLNGLQINDMGIGLIVQTYRFAGLSGHTPILQFDSVVGTAPTGIGFELIYEPQLAQSPSGRYLLLDDVGVSPPMSPRLYDSYIAGTTPFGDTRLIPGGNSMSMQIDHAQTRILQYFKNVYDINGTLLGELPAGSFLEDFAILSPNGERAYRLIRTAGGSRLDVHDLTATPNPQYPLIDQIPLPAHVLAPGEDIELWPNQTLTVAAVMSRDGRYLFLAGPERIVVVDVSN